MDKYSLCVSRHFYTQMRENVRGKRHMEKIFDPDNAFWSVIRKILYLIELSLAWFVCSLPLITIGTSTSALYYATVKAVRKERSYPLREFWKAWKLNIKYGTVLTVILAAVSGMALFADFVIGVSFLQLNNISDCIFTILFLVKDFILLGVICHIFPLLSRFDMPVFKLLETAVFLCIGNAVRTLAVSIVVILTALIIKEEVGFVIILPALCCFVVSFLLEPMYQKYYREKDINGENGIADAWYAEK